MEKWIMVEVAVKVDTDLEDVENIVDNLEINIEGNDVCDVKKKSVENFYGFNC
jgi:hypothetical protein